MDYAIAKGVTMRDDSILVQPPPHSWYHAEMAQEFWPRWPVILEHEHYGGSKARGAWSGDLLLQSVEDYHASYMSIHWWPREELVENRETVARINRRLGYRLQLREMNWPAEARLGEPFTVDTVWANAGVAPCHPGGFWALTLKDEKGGIVSVSVDEHFDLGGGCRSGRPTRLRSRRSNPASRWHSNTPIPRAHMRPLPSQADLTCSFPWASATGLRRSPCR
jgi:hypothetical protein